MIPYSSTKVAVICLTKALEKQVAGEGDITANSISPAVVQAKILDSVAQSIIEYGQPGPMGRPGRTEENAALVHYLVFPEASFTSSQCYKILAGRTAD